MQIRAQIQSTGAAFPSQRLASTDIDCRLGKSSGWLQSLCGVATRTVVSGNETQEGLGVDAARQALSNACMDAADIDLILFAASVGRQPIPATAALLKTALGLSGNPCPAYDINATCLSALIAMDVASMHIETKRARNVLVVASEIATRALPWQTDPATAGLFGDGAGAVVLNATSSKQSIQMKQVVMQTWSEGYDCCTLAAGGTRFDYHTQPEDFAAHSLFQMDGHSLFKLTRKILPQFIQQLLSQTGWKTNEIDLVVPHQASPLALEHMIRRCGFSAEQVINTVKDTGNLVAASLPTTLHKARTEGRISQGDKILMIGTSAGVSIGGATLQA